jgi:predicted MPP superfamily phosphohydrolase
MPGLAIALIIYAFMHFWIYKRVSLVFELSPRNRGILQFLLVLMGGLLFLVYFVEFLSSVRIPFLLYVGTLWQFGVPALFTLAFLDLGLFMAFPSRSRWWRISIPLLYALFVFRVSLFIPYGRRFDPYRFFPGEIIRMSILFLVLFILYKIISTSLQLPERKRGGLIIIFSLGALLNLLGMGIGFLSVMFGIYGVAYARIVWGFDLTRRWRRVLIFLFCTGFVMSIPQMTFWGNGLGLLLLYRIGGFWFGLFAMGATLFMLESAVSLLVLSYRRVRVIAVLVILALASGYGVVNGLRVPVVKELEIRLKNLPERASGFTVVQWTDLHLGDLLSADWLQKTVAKTNALEPDLVVITGDLTDNGFKDKERYIALLGQLKARYGVYAVTGNHEYYWNRLPEFNEITKKAGIRVLRNESVTVADGIQIAGINDPTGEEFGDEPANLAAALKNVDFRKPVILLSHHPVFFTAAVNYGVNLQLSGHTHAGQIPPMDLLAGLNYTYFYGLYREGDAYIHTSCGTGLWGVPMRIFSRNEITKIVLTGKKDN